MSASSKEARLGIGFSTEERDRLQVMSKKLDVSQSALLAALLMHSSESAIQEAVNAYRVAQEAKKKAAKEAKKAIGDLSPEEIALILAARQKKAA